MAIVTWHYAFAKTNTTAITVHPKQKSLPACKLNLKNKPKISAVKMAHVLFWTFGCKLQKLKWLLSRRKKGVGEERHKERERCFIAQIAGRTTLLDDRTKGSASGTRAKRWDLRSLSPGFPLSTHSQVWYSWSFFLSYWSPCGKKPVPWQAQFSNPARKRELFLLSLFFNSREGRWPTWSQTHTLINHYWQKGKSARIS